MVTHPTVASFPHPSVFSTSPATKAEGTLPKPSLGKIIAVLHQANSSPGLLGDLLQRAGYSLERCCPAIGQPLPETLDEYAAVVVFGGPMSANDDATLPFIRTELDWIANVLAANKPYLGICLGAQLLARVLGGVVHPHPAGLMEIGYSDIQQTPAGKAIWGDLQQVFQWHREGFTVPSDAVLLATGDRFPNQAYCYGEQVYGVQFHPEITAPLIDRWTTLAAEHLQRPEAQSKTAQLQSHARYGKAVERWLWGFLNQWLDNGAASWDLIESA